MGKRDKVKRPLRVLIVEDSEEDALLMVRELERGGYDPTFERVETAEKMKEALCTKTWDLVLADYSLPHFSGLEALEVLKASGLDLPFIIVSGAIGEDVAVQAMKAGAHDYLMKDKLKRLVPAIEQELREAGVRRKLKESDKDLRTTTEQLRALALRLTSAREEEAKRIARELHDELGSALTTLNWEIESIHKSCSEAGDHLDLPTLLEKIKGLTRKVESAVNTLRQISSELLPPVLDKFGLLAALEWYGEQWASRTGIAIHVQGEELSPRLSPQAEVSLFRIAQEALNNVVKHAGAAEVVITVEEEKGTVRLVISDNGIGFDTSRTAAAGRGRGIGILNMSERAQSVGGRFTVESSPGKGTRAITEIDTFCK
jgi:signal transduction histidine kinase